MSSKPKKARESGAKEKGRAETRKRSAGRPSKKDQIISLFLSGMGEVEDIAVITGARPSYVGSVLQEAGLHSANHPPRGDAGLREYAIAGLDEPSVELVVGAERLQAGDRLGFGPATQRQLPTGGFAHLLWWSPAGDRFG